MRPVNILPALDFGTTETVFEREEQASILNAAAVVRRAQARLAGYQDGDLVLAAGDPALIGIVCVVAALRGGGRLQILKWDKQERRYYRVDLDLRGK